MITYEINHDKKNRKESNRTRTRREGRTVIMIKKRKLNIIGHSKKKKSVR